MGPLDAYTLSKVIDEYVEEHENDAGGRTFMEENSLCMRMLHHLARVLEDYDQLKGTP